MSKNIFLCFFCLMNRCNYISSESTSASENCFTSEETVIDTTFEENDDRCTVTEEKVVDSHVDKEKTTVHHCTDTDENKPKQKHDFGLLHYREWWERNEVELLVNGKLIEGTPIFIEENTLRVINNEYSYFIPLEKVDYIRTNNGLQSSFKQIGEG